MKRVFNKINYEQSTGLKIIVRHIQQSSTHLVRDRASVKLVLIDSRRQNSDTQKNGSKIILTPILKILFPASITILRTRIRLYLQDNDIFLTYPKIGITFPKTGYIIRANLLPYLEIV